MNPGQVLLLATFLVSIGLIFCSFRSVKKQEWDKNIERMLYLTTAMVTLTSVYLVYNILVGNFNLIYVFSYSSKALPLVYKISAFWAGNSGSLLLWSWILIIYMLIFLLVERKDRLSAFSIGVSSLVLMFFLLVLNVASNPFNEFNTNMLIPDGKGLNPLLQTYEMVIHPPLLFLGFTCVTIPFAMVVAGSWLSEDWLPRSRKWVILSWIFLTQGNFWGALWAYAVLGWGGFWAWDPVENTSLLPWLIVSALLHGVLMQRVTGKMRNLNVILAVFSFELVLLGTFLTRSGLLGAVSVHSFSSAQIELIIMFLVALIAVPVGAAIAVMKGRTKGKPKAAYQEEVKEVKETKKSSWKEMSFWLCIGFLVIFTLAVLSGTLIPALYKIFTGGEFSLKQPYYLSFAKPLGILFIILIGVCIRLAWKGKLSEEKLLVPLIAAFAGILIGKVTFGTEAGLALGVTAFALTSHILSVRRNKNWGMLVTHTGLLLIFISVVFAWSYSEETFTVLQLDKPEHIGQYTLVYSDMEYSRDNLKETYTQKIQVYEGGELIGVAEPKIQRYYSPMSEPIPVGRVSIIDDWFKDIYIAVNPHKDFMGTGITGVTIYIKPVIDLIWIGCIIITAGGVISLYQMKRVKNLTIEPKR